jgi:hypothetical protein
MATGSWFYPLIKEINNGSPTPQAGAFSFKVHKCFNSALALILNKGIPCVNLQPCPNGMLPN